MLSHGTKKPLLTQFFTPSHPHQKDDENLQIIQSKNLDKITALACHDYVPALFYLANYHAQPQGLFGNPHTRRALSIFAKVIIEINLQQNKFSAFLGRAHAFIKEHASKEYSDYHQYAKALLAVTALTPPKDSQSDSFILTYFAKLSDDDEFEYHYSEGISRALNKIRTDWLVEKKYAIAPAKAPLHYGESPHSAPLILVEKNGESFYLAACQQNKQLPSVNSTVQPLKSSALDYKSAPANKK